MGLLGMVGGETSYGEMEWCSRVVTQVYVSDTV